MKKIIAETRTLLEGLAVEISRGHFNPEKKPRSAVGWKGPGVTFTTRVTPEKRPPFSPGPEPQTVVTPHAHSAGMILARIDRAFSPLLGNHIRFDFFERLAEAADEYIAFIPPEKDSAPSLLRVLLREASDILAEMESGEFPCVHLEGDKEP
jgi:hypothetical protein